MTNEEATVVVEAMTAIPFFPSAQAAQALIGDELMAMCETAQQGMWLARRVAQLYPKWPGIREVRAVFCARHSPKDGLDLDSGVYRDGIPSEFPGRNIPRLQSTREAIAPVDPAAAQALDELVREVAARSALERMPRKRLLERIEVVQPITEADMEHEEKAWKKGYGNV